MIDKVLVPKLDILKLDRIGKVRQDWRHLCSSVCLCVLCLREREREIARAIAPEGKVEDDVRRRVGRWEFKGNGAVADERIK